MALGFIAITTLWLARERVAPAFDNGTHLTWAFVDADLIRSGDLLGPFRIWTSYPPVGHIVGSLGVLVAGRGVNQPTIAQNLVFVPLLALGCYEVGRLVSGHGLLAVVFALAAPMLAELFHGPLLDAPEAAMVAVSVWLLLASERFARPGLAAVAGGACALGALTKETFTLFVAGVIVAMLLRGGWRERRGMVAFAVPILLIAVPWYAYHYNDLHGLTAGSVASIGNGGIATSNAAGSVYPPRLSFKNAGWYFWSDLNIQVFAPLMALAALGTVFSAARFLRDRRGSDLTPELLLGGFVAWAGITYVMPHDPRYSLPGLVYLAVLGTGWIGALPRLARVVAGAGLAAVLVVNLLGTSFGVGSQVVVTLPGAPPGSSLHERQVTFFRNIGPPHRDGDLVGLMRALKREGVPTVHWDGVGESLGDAFTLQGIGVDAEIAGLNASIVSDYHTFGPRDAFLIRRKVGSIGVPACLRLDATTAVWVQLGDPTRPGVKFFCPLRRPSVYG